MHERVASRFGAVVLALFVNVAGATTASSGAAAQAHVPLPSGAPCQAVERAAEGRSAGDSTTVRGRRVPRTRQALAALYSSPVGPLPFYPGERVVVGVGARRLGLAVFDGCALVPEWPGSERTPHPDEITSFEIVDFRHAPTHLRDTRGYRVLHVTAWKAGAKRAAT